MSAKTTYQLPFRGSWFVVWGGSSKELNRHHDNPTEKYALDLLVVDAKQDSHKDTGDQNEDYYAFGQDILAPRDGVVVEAVDGYRDNVPQKTTNDYGFSGNHVIIQHEEGVYSLLAHMRQGSIRVKAGQSVKAGQLLGSCGNSGNSTEPHLHFQLMNDSVFAVFDPKYARKVKARSIRPYFELGLWDGKTFRNKARYSPVRKDIIKPT